MKRRTKDEIRALYKRIGINLVLFGLASECPYDGSKVCPVEEILALKSLDLADRFDRIKSMTEEEKDHVLEKALECAETCQYNAK